MTKVPGRAVVTGAGAFVGSHVCRMLAEYGTEVHAVTLDGKIPAVIQNNPAIIVHTADITDADSIRGVMEKVRPEVVYHLAAFGTLTRERAIESLVGVNILGTQNTLAAAAAHGCRAFVQAGSAKVYAPSRQPITEDQPLQPWDEYAATKAAAEFFCRLTAEKQGLTVTVLRLSPIYGPGEDESRFLPTAIRAVWQNQPFTVSVASLVRNFTYVDDIVNAFIQAGQRRGGYDVFNIGAEQVISFGDILAEVERSAGRALVIQHSSPVSTSDDSWVLDSSRAQRILKWKPRITLSEGIRRTMAWYQHETGFQSVMASPSGQLR